MQTDTLNVEALHRRLAADHSIAGYIQLLLHYLQYSEYELILYMQREGQWTIQKPAPVAPPGYQKGEGSVDAGLFLFWINHASSYIKDKDIMHGLWILKIALVYYGLPMPTSQLKESNYKRLDENNLVYDDGSILGTNLYETYDQGWFVAFFNLVVTIIYYDNGVLPAPPPVITLNKATDVEVKIGMLGDWGSGTEVAQTVMNQLVGLQPDYLVHLGDVYYSGTPGDDYTHYYATGEEQDHLLSIWPDAYAGASFTLNSNHEMYCGAHGLLDVALASRVFAKQGGATYYALQCGDWTLLCLDSAFYADVTHAYMYGNIGNEQASWIKSLQLQPAKVIVLTHHNGFEYNCSNDTQAYYTPFWNQVSNALGGDPYAWYWGHIHNGIVYNSPVTIGDFATNTYCRCLGHGAIPFGNASSLQNLAGVEWYANNPPVDAAGKEVSNGSVLLSFALQDNQVTAITENFYDVSGLPQPVWSKIIFQL
ncbi:hypothetical protein SAMN05421788_11719 [Filimonas lacunae]|uniref:Calcineurin-like phosphoesterase n=1 Tax=Filimonas lacunae TaxID=477680 RepID=A0A173MEG2_9BACT|nr:metallophosphoesterase [Filimonas lacunae]BAV05907.1 hypothetical protein FLA_1919 [Filimonas lacunae]SIT34532.1 hypothetical protein SAMN05421788_11719 [Filimonas lacunae]